MQITFDPQRRDGALALSKAGDVLTINSTALDLSGLLDGHYLPPEAIANELLRDARRVDGEVQVTVLLPLAADAPHEARYPAILTDVPDGAIAIPGAATDD